MSLPSFLNLPTGDSDPRLVDLGRAWRGVARSGSFEFENGTEDDRREVVL